MHLPIVESILRSLLPPSSISIFPMRSVMCTQGCCIISRPMYRIRYSIYTRAYIYISHTTAFPSHIELNYSSEFTLCSRHSPEPVSRNRWWTMASFLLPLSLIFILRLPSVPPCILSASISLNYFIFVSILGASATRAITGRDCVSDTRRWDGDPYKSENDGTGVKILNLWQIFNTGHFTDIFWNSHI